MNFYEQFQKCLQQNLPEQALANLQQHLSIHRGHARGFFQAGSLLYSMKRWPEALDAFLEACRLDPEQSEFHVFLGGTYRRLQQPDLATMAYNRALEKRQNPEIRYYKSMTLLLSGHYQEGWAEHEWRILSRQLGYRYTWHPMEKRWHGQPFPGQTLVVYNEQGFGDDLQFCRYLPYVKALGGEVIFSTRPPLSALMTTVCGADRIIEHRQATGPRQPLDYNWAVPLMSLPAIFGATAGFTPTINTWHH